jgi:2-(1,2-epoxy-1,2-dihydrophenyl)acetyl-CoA isomerase
MNNRLIRTDRVGYIGYVTLNRPDKLNALNLDMALEMRSAFQIMEQDPEIRVVILRGEGRVFCSGLDLVKDPVPAYRFKATMAQFHDMIRSMVNMRKPIIAQVQGAAAGGGISLAHACDLIVCADDAKLCEIFVQIAAVPDLGCTWLLPRHIGLARARELMYTGDAITPSDALAIGLVNRVVPAAELATATRELAERIASRPPLAVGYIKEMTLRSLEMSFEGYLTLEAYAQATTLTQPDHAEGVAAFLEKRPPKFHGN